MNQAARRRVTDSHTTFPIKVMHQTWRREGTGGPEIARRGLSARREARRC